ncbi:MAG: hypothetical protein RLZZ244_2034 [Verrucomicrobiota bacterium]
MVMGRAFMAGGGEGNWEMERMNGFGNGAGCLTRGWHSLSQSCAFWGSAPLRAGSPPLRIAAMQESAFHFVAERMSQTRIFQEYEAAFRAAAGMPLRFDPVGAQASGARSRGGENPFCVLLSQSQAGCRMCLEVDARLKKEEEAGREGGGARTEVCLAGLVDTSVPVKMGERVLGYLRTGQVATGGLKRSGFKRVARILLEWGLNTDLKRLEEAWFHSRVLEPAQYEAFVGLLQVFAKHLSVAAEEMATVAAEHESPLIRRAREVIASRQHEDLRIESVAKALNISVFYFCKVFKKATGMTFTAYLAAVRVAKAKNLLLNPHTRISEVAFQAGFQSITHFNRVFRESTGRSPTVYRRELGAGGREAESEGRPIES